MVKGDTSCLKLQTVFVIYANLQKINQLILLKADFDGRFLGKGHKIAVLVVSNTSLSKSYLLQYAVLWLIRS